MAQHFAYVLYFGNLRASLPADWLFLRLACQQHVLCLTYTQNIMAVAAEGRVNPTLHSQIRGLVRDGTFRARLLGADRFQLETRALCAERLTWQVALLC